MALRTLLTSTSRMPWRRTRLTSFARFFADDTAPAASSPPSSSLHSSDIAFKPNQDGWGFTNAYAGKLRLSNASVVTVKLACLRHTSRCGCSLLLFIRSSLLVALPPDGYDKIFGKKGKSEDKSNAEAEQKQCNAAAAVSPAAAVPEAVEQVVTLVQALPKDQRQQLATLLKSKGLLQ